MKLRRETATRKLSITILDMFLPHGLTDDKTATKR